MKNMIEPQEGALPQETGGDISCRVSVAELKISLVIPGSGKKNKALGYLYLYLVWAQSIFLLFGSQQE